MDWIMDYILDWTLCFRTFQGFPLSNFCLIPKIRFLCILRIYIYMVGLRPRQLVHQEIGIIELEAEVVYSEHAYLLRQDALTAEPLEPHQWNRNKLCNSQALQEASSNFSWLSKALIH